MLEQIEYMDVGMLDIAVNEIQGNGMMAHISQMMVQMPNKMLKGETENLDILNAMSTFFVSNMV